MRIGELARCSGVSVRALRYYEEQGLLTPERTPSGQRWYTEEAVDLVRLFQQCYAAGLSSRAIAVLLPCVGDGRSTPGQREMLRAERDRLAARIDDMTRALHRLDEIVAAADDRRAADRRSAGGAGAEADTGPTAAR